MTTRSISAGWGRPRLRAGDERFSRLRFSGKGFLESNESPRPFQPHTPPSCWREVHELPIDGSSDASLQVTSVLSDRRAQDLAIRRGTVSVLHARHDLERLATLQIVGRALPGALIHSWVGATGFHETSRRCASQPGPRRPSRSRVMRRRCRRTLPSELHVTVSRHAALAFTNAPRGTRPPLRRPSRYASGADGPSARPSSLRGSAS